MNLETELWHKVFDWRSLAKRIAEGGDPIDIAEAAVLLVNADELEKLLNKWARSHEPGR